jgi:hypothetical protein
VKPIEKQKQPTAKSLHCASREMYGLLVLRGLRNGSIKAKPVLTFGEFEVEMQSVEELVTAAIESANGGRL